MGKKEISAEEPNKYQSRFMIFFYEITSDVPLQPKVIEEIELNSLRNEKTKKESEGVKLN